MRFEQLAQISICAHKYGEWQKYISIDLHLFDEVGRQVDILPPPLTSHLSPQLATHTLLIAVSGRTANAWLALVAAGVRFYCRNETQHGVRQKGAANKD